MLRPAFNLYFNTVCSFLVGYWIVWVVLRLFRVGESRWKYTLLLLPFIKVVWDLSIRGIPESSILYAGIDPLSLPPKSQTLTIGTGASQWGPIFHFVFTSHDPIAHHTYSTSVADYFFALFNRFFGEYSIVLIGAVAASFSLILVMRRIFDWVRFELNRREHRRADLSLKSIPLLFRAVDVSVSSFYSGTPFTGGIFRPYICIPKSTFALLTEEETSAVIQHELAHIRQLDLVGTFFIQLLGDLFWFIPLYRGLSGKIDRLREILADDAAVHAGAARADLASGLLKLREWQQTSGQTVLYSAFFRERSLVKTRIERLLGLETDAAERMGWNHLWVRIVILFWTAGGVMSATLGGNHEVSVQATFSWMDLLPFGIGSLLRGWGFS
jgi:Zn-dependent protease with chaperone function